MTKFTQLVSANARAESGPLTVQANALNAGLPFNMPHHHPHTHAHLQEGVGNWTQAYFIFFTRNPVNQLLMRVQNHAHATVQNSGEC